MSDEPPPSPPPASMAKEAEALKEYEANSVQPLYPSIAPHSSQQPSPPPAYEPPPAYTKQRTLDVAILVKAADFAARRHRAQKRKDLAQTPYINHPLGVAHLLADVGEVDDIATLAAAYLHDTVEDTKTTYDELEREFGVEIASLVRDVSFEDKNVSRERRRQLMIERAASMSPKAKLIELADKLYNVRDLRRSTPIGWTRVRIHEYAIWARSMLAAIRGSNEALEAELDDAINQILAH